MEELAVLSSQAAAEWGWYAGSSLRHCRYRNLDPQLCWGRGRQNCVRKRRWQAAGDFCEEKEGVCSSCWTTAAEKVHYMVADECWWHCVTKRLSRWSVNNPAAPGGTDGGSSGRLSSVRDGNAIGRPHSPAREVCFMLLLLDALCVHMYQNLYNPVWSFSFWEVIHSNECSYLYSSIKLQPSVYSII